MEPENAPNPPSHPVEPTYRQRFNINAITGALALIVSVAVAMFTGWNELNRDATTARQNLTDTLTEIIKIDREAIELLASSLAIDQIEAASFSLQNRKLVLLRQAEALFETLEEEVTAEDSAMISMALSSAGEFEKAEKYMNIFLEKNTFNLGQLAGLRSMAILAAAQGNRAKAESLLEQALAAVNPPRNDAEYGNILIVEITKVMLAISFGDYDKAGKAIEGTAKRLGELQCTPGRKLWRQRIYDLARGMALRGKFDLARLESVEAGEDCIYDDIALVRGDANLHNGRYEGFYNSERGRVVVFGWSESMLAMIGTGQQVQFLERKELDGEFGVVGWAGNRVRFHVGEQGEASGFEWRGAAAKVIWVREQ